MKVWIAERGKVIAKNVVELREYSVLLDDGKVYPKLAVYLHKEHCEDIEGLLELEDRTAYTFNQMLDLASAGDVFRIGYCDSYIVFVKNGDSEADPMPLFAEPEQNVVEVAERHKMKYYDGIFIYMDDHTPNMVINKG